LIAGLDSLSKNPPENGREAVGNQSPELFPNSPPDRRKIPESIRLHPKLDQASKLCWVFLWEQADFRPNTINTTPARIGAALGQSERSAKRWLAKLQEAGCLELVDQPKRGEWLFYVSAMHAWENTLGIPAAQLSIGTSGPNPPIQNQETGNAVPGLPNTPPLEKDSEEISDQEAASLALLTREIARKQASMPSDRIGGFGLGTAHANRTQSKESLNQDTVDCRPLAQGAPPVEESKTKSALASARNLSGPCSPEVARSINQLSGVMNEREKLFNECFDWLRREWPDAEEVYTRLLHRIATAIVSGHLQKAVLSKLVSDAKGPRIELPAVYFCKTIKKLLPKIAD